MCLSKITKRMDVPTKGKGYKVFRRYPLMNGKPSKSYGGEFMGGKYKKNVKYTATLCAISSPWQYNGYVSGFHIFTNKKDAQTWTEGHRHLLVVQVEYEDGHTVGTQELNGKNKLRVIVATKMKIIGEIE